RCPQGLDGLDGGLTNPAFRCPRPWAVLPVEPSSLRRDEPGPNRRPKPIDRYAVGRSGNQENGGRRIDRRPEDADETERLRDTEDGIAPPKESSAANIGGGCRHRVPVANGFAHCVGDARRLPPNLKGPHRASPHSDREPAEGEERGEGEK